MAGVKKILVVEDESALRQVIKTKFEKKGFAVEVAADGAEALDIFKQEKPDLILLDILMPVMDGFEMLARLRQDEYGKVVPVIILTNLSDPDPTAKALKYGVHDFLVKTDWELEDVVGKVKEKLGLK